MIKKLGLAGGVIAVAMFALSEIFLLPSIQQSGPDQYRVNQGYWFDSYRKTELRAQDFCRSQGLTLANFSENKWSGGNRKGGFGIGVRGKLYYDFVCSADQLEQLK